MKRMVAVVGASILFACSSEKDVSAILEVTSSAGASCVGVAGFEVIVEPAGVEPKTHLAFPPSPILSASECVLPGSSTFSDLAIDTPVSVTITGYDGSGTKARVSGHAFFTDLRANVAPLDLKPAAMSLPPVLVFYRTSLLQGATWPEVESMSITEQMGNMPILTVDRKSAGEFFDQEPGAYGISDWVNGVNPINKALTVKFTAPGKTPRDGKISVVSWKDNAYYFAQ